jgi:hypothetical protein
MKEYLDLVKQASRARDMAVGETTQKMDKFTVFTKLVFPDNPGPSELANTKSLVENWLLWSLSGRPFYPLAALLHKFTRDCETQQAGFVGVPEAKYLEIAGRGYPMAAIGVEEGEGGLNELARRGDSDKPAAKS